MKPKKIEKLKIHLRTDANDPNQQSIANAINDIAFKFSEILDYIEEHEEEHKNSFIDGFKKGHFKGVLDREYGQTTSEEDINAKPQKKKWKPASGEEYYYISDMGDVEKTYWGMHEGIDNVGANRARFRFHNVFKTYKEAQQMKDKISKLLREE